MSIRRDKGLTRWVRRTEALQDVGYLVDSSGRLVHRTICRAAWGWFPHPWVVHHVDGNKRNNEPVNLIAMPRQVHDNMHKAMREHQCTFTREAIAKMIRCSANMRAKGKSSFTVTIAASDVRPVKVN